MRIRDLESFNLAEIRRHGDPAVRALEQAIDETLQRVFGHGTIEYTRYSDAAILDSVSMYDEPPVFETQREVGRNMEAALSTLKQAARGIEEDLTFATAPLEPAPIPPNNRTRSHEQLAPASDRIVRLDHNSPAFVEADGALSDVQNALKGLANATDTDTHARLTAELDAGRRLFQAPAIRVALLGAVLGAVLTSISVTFPDFGISLAASAAWSLVVGCFQNPRED
jgi:hypothetical protein